MRALDALEQKEQTPALGNLGIRQHRFAHRFDQAVQLLQQIRNQHVHDGPLKLAIA